MKTLLKTLFIALVAMQPLLFLIWFKAYVWFHLPTWFADTVLHAFPAVGGIILTALICRVGINMLLRKPKRATKIFFAWLGWTIISWTACAAVIAVDFFI